MIYDYTRRFCCFLRWALYAIGGLLIIYGHGWGGACVISWAFIWTGIEVRPDQLLAARSKLYGITWIIYYFCLLGYVIKVKGEVFGFPDFGIFFLIPFIPEVVIFEISEFRRK